MSLPTVILKPGRERSALRRHPWVFSGAIAQAETNVAPGETVAVRSADGEVVGTAAFSPQSQIALRMWTFGTAEEDTEKLVRERIVRAAAARPIVPPGEPETARRLVNAESDGLPGIVVDRYAQWLVCQFSSAGAERWRSVVVDALLAAVPCSGIYDRSDLGVRRKEGLEERTGRAAGEEPPDRIEIGEAGCRYFVDVKKGHKTGFYLDQRESRAAVARYARDAEVLNCYSYTGGFGVAAAVVGATRVVNIDSSGSVLALGDENFRLNGIAPDLVENVDGNVPGVLRQYRDRRRTFDTIVLDPPKFVESRSQLDKGLRGYKDINILALKLLRPGGTLMTFSCSGLVGPELFQSTVADAAADAGREARIVGDLSQPDDHPVLLSFPEGRYLKGLVIRVA